ncbi:MAG: DUF1146 domain-containing protein [Lactobacillaceae bacterium]|jgi:uncharacterized integral membrane protein (TIGR02327 family)|nr:DUF1146 domain-containing protein [Lactobacillaceae bacterium]
MEKFIQFIFVLFLIYVSFWSMRNIEFGSKENIKKAPSQFAVLRVLLAIVLGYLVSSFFISISQLILS